MMWLKDRQALSSQAVEAAQSPVVHPDLTGHYIEDDPLDALALTGLLNGEAGIHLTTSTSLTDLQDWVGDSDLDFLLVDIYRPDSRPFKEEIGRIRTYSQAPVFFITGDEAKYYVADALEVGAEGVLEKEKLTADYLVEALHKVASHKYDPPPQLRPDDGPYEWLGADDGAAASVSTYDQTQPDFAYEYIQNGLRKASLICAEGAAAGRVFEALADAHLLLKESAPDQLVGKAISAQSVPRVILNLQRGALSLAKQHGVRLGFHTSDSVFGELAISQAATLIRHLLRAVIIGTQAGETIKFNAMSNADGIRLSVASTGRLPFDVDDVVGRRLPSDPQRMAPTILLTAVCILMKITSSNLTVFSRGSCHTLLIDLKDR